MKIENRFILFFVFGILLFSVSCTNSDPEARTQKRLTELFKICKETDSNKQAAAEYIVYRGPDETRKWQDVYDYSNPDEKERVDNTCWRIRGYLDWYKKWEFGKFQVDKENEGAWYIQEVIFTDKDGSDKLYFAFLEINGKFALGDID